jgi:hypothetical protein
MPGVRRRLDVGYASCAQKPTIPVMSPSGPRESTFVPRACPAARAIEALPARRAASDGARLLEHLEMLRHGAERHVPHALVDVTRGFLTVPDEAQNGLATG